MNTRAMLIVAVSILAACSEKQTITMNVDREKFRAFNVAALTTQLANINYPTTVTHEDETLHIRVGQASVSDVRRAICRQMGWPSAEGKMVRIADTLRLLRAAGIAKVKIIDKTQALEVELEQDGKCKKAS